MSLIDEAMENCVIMDKTTAPDGYGGIKTVWKDGAPIMAAFSFNSSTQARIAAQQGVNNRYTVLTNKKVVLQDQDVIKRLSDEKYFRITSDGKDNRTPKSAGLDLRAVEAEQWEITNDE